MSGEDSDGAMGDDSEGKVLCTVCYEESSNAIGKQMIRCNGCKIEVCTSCTLYWKLTHDSCPQRCSTPWNVNLPDLSDNGNGGFEGYVACPRCNRLGSLHCRYIACRKLLEFHRSAEHDIGNKCQHCDKPLEAYRCGGCCYPHMLFHYYGCSVCKRRYCC